jgi:predicted porin
MSKVGSLAPRRRPAGWRAAVIAGLAAVGAGGAARADDALTWRGLTLYGTLDMGVAWLSHGAPLSPDFPPGLPFTIQKFSDRATFSVAPNGLAQSRLGLAGNEALGDGVSAIFRLETGFQPTSGHLTDGPRSLIAANGIPLKAQTTSGDTSRAGQALQGAAWAGLDGGRFGALTFGRQNSLLLDDLIAYDPQAQSYAFSPIGYSGVVSGAGDTQDARFDSAVKYVVSRGPVRLALLHQFGGVGRFAGDADEADVGLRFGGVSADVAYGQVNNAIAVASLNAAQAAAAPGTLAATISDNTALTAQAKAHRGPLTLYGGYEHIVYLNPAHPLAPGFRDIGGYVVSVVNNTAYDHHRILQISWVGARLALTRSLDLTGAYYRYDQASYQGDGCSDASAPSCAGSLGALSGVVDYRLNRHFDVYGGVIGSRVSGGPAAGFLHTGSVATMEGVRLGF